MLSLNLQNYFKRAQEIPKQQKIIRKVHLRKKDGSEIAIPELTIKRENEDKQIIVSAKETFERLKEKNKQATEYLSKLSNRMNHSIKSIDLNVSSED